MSPESTVLATAARPGSPYPLGATATADGVNFAVHAPDATAVAVCLLDRTPHGAIVETRIALTERTFGIWHGSVVQAGVGSVYGFRVAGPWDPHRGLRFNDVKLLLDPYARQITGPLGEASALLAYADTPFGSPSEIDSLGHVPMGVVCAPTAATGPRPDRPWDLTVIYELHVGSFTGAHPGVPEHLRGTYLALAEPAVISHLLGLGVTAVELLPVHAFLSEYGVRARGMRNHWGYSTGAYFAPEPSYAAEPGREREEFAQMVTALHEAGLEVILDVVYNHTCETGVEGPSISWRGFDSPGYYALDADGEDKDITGCGNTVDSGSATVVRMVCDSLRHWVQEMGVDGFRFDLTSVLGRPRAGAFDPRAALVTAISSDPILARTKLICEPWDATGEGYQVGNFPVAWTEWNDRYRDTVRRFFAGTTGVRELASRMAGSQDIYDRSGRRPWASINFVTAHDGFTARDLVSYERKHNDANGEGGRDGTDNNNSVNYGVEGPSDDPAVLAARARHVRAMLSTLVLSTGTPMLLAGDEIGHTQQGNNNAYCVAAQATAAQAWALDWASADTDLTATLARALRVRRSSPVLRRQKYFTGRDGSDRAADLLWFGADGMELTTDQWNDDGVRTLQARVDLAVASGTPGTALVVVHSGGSAEVILPTVHGHDEPYRPLFDSAAAGGLPTDESVLAPGSTVTVTGAAVLVFDCGAGVSTARQP